MNNECTNLVFTPNQHAMLFGWIAKEVIERFGEAGKNTITKGVRLYGEQRGRRMALRVLADGHDLTVLNYMVYGEWEAREGELILKFPETSPDLHMEAHKCPWHSEWEKNDLLQYAHLYCKDVDIALVRGFNSQLKLDLLKNRSEGADFCDFWFRKANINEVDSKIMAERKDKLGRKAKMPWEYHIGHIYKTMNDVVVFDFGNEGKGAILSAMGTFAKHYGKDIAETILKYYDTDFDLLPQYNGINA